MERSAPLGHVRSSPLSRLCLAYFSLAIEAVILLLTIHLKGESPSNALAAAIAHYSGSFHRLMKSAACSFIALSMNGASCLM